MCASIVKLCPSANISPVQSRSNHIDGLNETRFSITDFLHHKSKTSQRFVTIQNEVVPFLVLRFW